MKFKVLSVRPPWSVWIMRGEKLIENRRRRIKHRGLLAIQQSKRIDYNAQFRNSRDERDREATSVICGVGDELGCIIGVVELIDCIAPWEALRRFPDQASWINTEPGTWCWVLKRPLLFKHPFKVRGMPGLFEVDIPDDLLPESVKSAHALRRSLSADRP